MNALVIAEGDRTALTEAMAALRDEDMFAKLRAGSGNNMLLQVQWAEIAARTAELYGDVLA